MPHQTIASLETALADVYQWLNELADELDEEDHRFVLRLLRAVLHALRDRLTTNQNAHLSAQLPLLVRGLYFEGWDPAPDARPDRTLQEFYERVGSSLTGDWDAELPKFVSAVFRLLGRHLSWGEDEKIVRELPRELSRLWSASLR